MTNVEDHSAKSPIGHLTKLAEGSIATLVAFRHYQDHPHRDPLDEVFTVPTIIFTLQGRWQFQSLNERGTVDPLHHRLRPRRPALSMSS